MRKILWLLLLLAPCVLHAQVVGPGFVNYVTSAPSGTCSQGVPAQIVMGAGTLYTCQSGTWGQVGAGTGTVTSIATTSPITGGTITGTGTIACATCVAASSPGAGIAHFAGSTQTVTSSAVSLTADVSGILPSANGGTNSAFFTVAGPASSAKTYTFANSNATIPQTIASGAKALATGAISSAACTSAQTDTATGTLTTDAIIASFNADPTAVTGYVPLTTGMLAIIVYPTTDTVNFKVCNNTSSSITPGAITLNWRVVR